MKKNERTHGDQMAIMGELNALYTTVIDLQKRITKLETIKELYEIKQKENKNDK